MGSLRSRVASSYLFMVAVYVRLVSLYFCMVCLHSVFFFIVVLLEQGSSTIEENMKKSAHGVLGQRTPYSEYQPEFTRLKGRLRNRERPLKEYVF